MSQDKSIPLDLVDNLIKRHMGRIAAFFEPMCKFTLVVRMPGVPEHDYIVSNDDDAEAIESMKRRLERKKDGRYVGKIRVYEEGKEE